MKIQACEFPTREVIVCVDCRVRLGQISIGIGPLRRETTRRTGIGVKRDYESRVGLGITANPVKICRGRGNRPAGSNVVFRGA